MNTTNYERTGNLSASLALLLSPAALTAVNKSDDDYVQSVPPFNAPYTNPCKIDIYTHAHYLYNTSHFIYTILIRFLFFFCPFYSTLDRVHFFIPFLSTPLISPQTTRAKQRTTDPSSIILSSVIAR
jgi:hypothetical protein